MTKLKADIKTADPIKVLAKIEKALKTPIGKNPIIRHRATRQLAIALAMLGDECAVRHLGITEWIVG